MGSQDNRSRKKWQDYGGGSAAKAEHNFACLFSSVFQDTEYSIEPQPSYFKELYVDVTLEEDDLLQIYTPPIPIKRHGVHPDCLIRNNRTGKSILVELKRQDGWVENKPREAGRGNAHERLCKYFTPGLLREFRSFCHIDSNIYPFWVVFQGDITRDPCRVREITHWFDGNKANYFFWRDTKEADAIINHFKTYIVPILE